MFALSEINQKTTYIKLQDSPKENIIMHAPIDFTSIVLVFWKD